MPRTGPQLRFATTRLATGPQVHYAEQGNPGAEAIVFVHPHADSWFSFSRVLSLLPARYHAYALDQRGHGDSERPACCYTIDDLAADIVAFLDGVEVERATLVGHSASGFIARRVAETHPDRVARLVLINCAVSLPTQVRREMQAAIQGFQDPLSVAFARELHASVTDVPLPEPILERLVAQSLKAPARVWRDGLEGLLGFDDAAELGRIVAPTLLMWGERDGLFSREEQERLAAAIPGTRLRVVPEAGHSPHLERPERVADSLDAFMREGDRPSDHHDAPAHSWTSLAQRRPPLTEIEASPGPVLQDIAAPTLASDLRGLRLAQRSRACSPRLPGVEAVAGGSTHAPSGEWSDQGARCASRD